MFLQKILTIAQILAQKILVILIVILLCLNYLNSTYFQCSTLLDKLGLSYYESRNDNYIWMHWCLVSTFVFMYTYLCQSIFRLQTVLQSRNVQIDHVFYISTAIDIELKQDNSTINNNNSAVKICTDS